MSLAITVHGSHVELSGAIDVATSPSLRVELTDMINVAGPGDVLKLNLAEVSFLDSSGLSVLLGAHKHAAGRKVQLTLAELPGHVKRTLNVTGLDEVLDIAR